MIVMAKSSLLSCLTLLILLRLPIATQAGCDPSSACWPTDTEIEDLEKLLDPSLDRSGLYRIDDSAPADGGSPYPSAIPIFSGGDQPLYGFGDIKDLKPLYVNVQSTREDECFVNSSFLKPENRDICFVSTRNSPYSGTTTQADTGTPGFVVFPVTASQVQSAVQFAKKHDLCISVLGTGHDFLDRHSNCEFGMLIRTSLLKDMEVIPSQNATKLGSGLTFSEVQAFLSPKNFYVASGWSVTVGILGWSIGGGHGPFAPSAGLGVDNIIEFDIVTADGELRTCNSENDNSDLFWAVRGGGGSTWGVITSISLKLHSLPEQGATLLQFYSEGIYCDKELVENGVDAYISVLPELDERWSGLTFITPTNSKTTEDCGLKYSAFNLYVFMGTEEEAQEGISKFLEVGMVKILSRPIHSWYDDYLRLADVEYISPTANMAPTDEKVGGVPSVLVPREKNEELANFVKFRLADCSSDPTICGRIEIYHCITGHSKQHFDAEAVSITSAFRSSLYHVVTGGGNSDQMDKAYEMLGDHCYPNECAYSISEESGGWESRRYGEQYERLSTVKNKYDPEGVFFCKHCIGDV